MSKEKLATEIEEITVRLTKKELANARALANMMRMRGELKSTELSELFRLSLVIVSDLFFQKIETERALADVY